MSIDEKGQPMSKREAVVEAMARAMNPNGWEPFDADLHGSPVAQKQSQAFAMRNAESALDAALSVLSEPDDWLMDVGLDADDEGGHFNIDAVWLAMLSTLRSPEK